MLFWENLIILLIFMIFLKQLTIFFNKNDSSPITHYPLPIVY